MPDWAENRTLPEEYHGFIDWMQSEKDSVDVYKNKRYAIVLPDTNEMIGMVGMGLEDTLNEVEMAYFMSENIKEKVIPKRL